MKCLNLIFVLGFFLLSSACNKENLSETQLVDRWEHSLEAQNYIKALSESISIITSATQNTGLTVMELVEVGKKCKNEKNMENFKFDPIKCQNAIDYLDCIGRVNLAAEKAKISNPEIFTNRHIWAKYASTKFISPTELLKMKNNK